MKKLMLFLLVGMFLFSLGVVSASSVTLNSPSEGETISEGSDVEFNCSVDTGAENISFVEILMDYDYDYEDEVIYTFEKGIFGENPIGENISVMYLDEYASDLANNPTYIIDQLGQTCGAEESFPPCFLFNTTMVSGTYWVGSRTNKYFTMTFNETFSISNFYLNQHGTFFANESKLEYSLDNETWTTIFDKTHSGDIDEDFSPVNAKYLKWTAETLDNGANLYVGYVNVTGQRLEETAFNGSLSYNYSGLAGGVYNWNCNAVNTGANISAVSDSEFTMNGTYIGWVSPSPSNGTEAVRIKLNTSITSNYDAYTLWDINDTLLRWYSFDDEDLSSVNDNFGVNLLTGDTLSYVSSTYGKAIELEEGGEGFYSYSTEGSDNGFTFAWTWNWTNISYFSGESSTFLLDVGYDHSNEGYKLRFRELNSTHSYFDAIIYNDSEDYVGTAKFTTQPFPNSKLTNMSRFLITADMINQEYAYYIDGVKYGETTTDFTGNYYDGTNVIRFYSPSNSSLLIDDIVSINRSVTDNEAELLSTYSKNNYFELDYTADTNITVKPYGYDSQGVLSFTYERTFNFLTSAIVDYTNLFNDGTTIYGYCRASYDTTPTEDLTHFIEYSTDNSTWQPMTETYERSDESWAVIGDSMYNGATDYPGRLATNMNMDISSDWDNLAVAGYTCTQVYELLRDNVTNGTTNLIAGCGVNGGIPTTNTDKWEDIYTLAKSKGISNIYMSTMPPWDTINTYDDTTANTYCDRQKSQNEWLIDYASTKSDLFVVDPWTHWHDTSGTNKTECGWRDDVEYNGDVTHPNALGYQYWADLQWNESFNQWTNDTWQTNLTPSFNGTHYFRCYVNGDRPSIISYFGETLVTWASASNLLAWLKLNENSGTTAYDSSANSNTGTLSENLFQNDGVTVTLTEGTDYSLADTIFTILNTTYSWTGINTTYTYDGDDGSNGYDAMSTTISGLDDFATWIAIIVVVIAAAIVLGVISMNFGRRRNMI